MNNEITALLEVVSALEDRAAEALGIPTALVKVEILHISFLVVDHSLRESSPHYLNRKAATLPPE